jgi:hypothetical protein
MVPQKLEIIRGLKMMKLKRDYDFIWHWIFNFLWCKETEVPVTIRYGIRWKCEGPFQVTYWRSLNLRVSEKPVTGHVVIGKAKSVYVEVKISDKYTFCEGSNKILPIRI